jgi:hypothetical protein
MIGTARRLPATHISVRVPWHDAGWNGHVCMNPRGNTSCLVLPRIAETRNDDEEQRLAGKPWDADGKRLPACAAERGAFMSPLGYSRRARHPYSTRNDEDGKRYAHFKETTFHHAPYSAAAVPFAWMMKGKNGIPGPAERYHLGYQPELEPTLSFDTLWVQERRNQLTMLDTFFSAVEPETSLVFFYAKRTPLADDGGRVIVGIGRVLNVDPPVEYLYEKGAPEDAMRCVLWERNVHHSIRPGCADGFLLPYHELLALAEHDAGIDLPQLVLRAPETCRDAFSMGAEHVSHDQAITVLIACASLLERLEKLVKADLGNARAVIDRELNRLWRLRGACPGLGSALTAFGLTHGTLVGHAIGQQLHSDGSPEIRDPWPLVDKVLRDPKQLPPDLAATLGPSTAKLWKSLKPERLALLKLLSRFSIDADQATRWFQPEVREEHGIAASDAQILENPYLCFEVDRGRPDPIPVDVIDHGLFPEAAITTAVPLTAPSHCAEPIDPRRVRALITETLDRAAIEGHALLPQSWLVERVRKLEIAPLCPLGADWFGAFADTLAPRLTPTQTGDGAPAWQLNELARAREIIAARVRRRLEAARHAAKHPWRALLDRKLGDIPAADAEAEEQARLEKTAALKEVYCSRLSVLIGAAGTGKTSLLSALIDIDDVAKGGVLLLAPTGKARVQMQRRAANAKALTLAQFLLGKDRYDPVTGAYVATGVANRERRYRTVIVDEASMLTEHQLAALLDAIEPASVERLILVGDPRQLPPIGAGRPFVDIIRHIRGRPPVNALLRGLAELKIVRRQYGQADASAAPRDDVLLARWFGDDAVEPAADEAWDRLARGAARGIRAIPWSNETDLQAKLLAEIKAATRRIAKAACGTEQESDEANFEVSLGGRPYNGRVYFNPARAADADSPRSGGGADAEAWQALSPLRAGETGVDGLNRWLQRTFRTQARAWAEPEKPWHRKVCKPLGRQGLLYGDKVIHVLNTRHFDVYPQPDDTAYLANGEIGLAVGQYKGASWKPKGLPWKLEVEFATQLGLKFGFQKRDFGEEGDAPLELAYALTIHKSQGSEFGTTFVILPNPCRLLSRELLYTALTRQKQEIVLLYQGDLRGLIALSSAQHSETARRLTNLFDDPTPIAHAHTFLEAGLIHRTTAGDLVRSKSEMAIANILHGLGIAYAYEHPFHGQNGGVRYPDFTIEDAETGKRILIEHLGMLSVPQYRRNWEAKLHWYRAQGVLPVEEGGGENGILFTTTEENGLDSATIAKQLQDLLCL